MNHLPSPAIPVSPSTTPQLTLPPETPTSETADNPPPQPYLIVGTTHLQQVLQNCVGGCSHCGSKQIKLDVQNKNGFGSLLKVTCRDCELLSDSLRKTVDRLQVKRSVLDRTTKRNRVKAKRIGTRLCRARSQYKKLKQNIESMRVGNSPSSKKSTFLDDELNIRAIMAAFHIGTAGHDISKVFGMIGVSGSRSFERNFSRHSPTIAMCLRETAKEFLQEALALELIKTIEEKSNTIVPEGDKTTIKQAVGSNEFNKINKKYLPLTISISYDMGWQKKGSGRQYDSMSGHGFFIGCRTGKVVLCGVLQKLCSICTSYEKRKLPPPEHTCNSNYSGGSGGMEALLCRQLVEEIHFRSDGMMKVEDLVTDDDSTLRDHCSSEENGGKLRSGVSQPKFLADPTHRTKVMVRPIFGLVQSTKNPDEVKMIDALRLKKYVSCYIVQHRNGDFETFVANAKAPVEHLFDNHEFCDESWCYAKELMFQTEQLVTQSQEQQVTKHANETIFKQK